MMKGKESI